MDSPTNEFNIISNLYNKLEYHQALKNAYLMLERPDLEESHPDIYNKVNFIISRILLLHGNNKESLEYALKCQENEESLLLLLDAAHGYDYDLYKNICFKLTYYNNKYIQKLIKVCLSDFDLGFLHTISVYRPIPECDFTSQLNELTSNWTRATAKSKYSQLLHDEASLDELISIKSELVSQNDLQYANTINLLISTLNDRVYYKLIFTSDNPVNITREFISYISKNGMNNYTEFILKHNGQAETNHVADLSKSNRISRDSRRHKSLESTSWHSSVPLKFFNAFNKAITFNENPKETFTTIFQEDTFHAKCNKNNCNALQAIISKTFNKRGLSGLVAFKLFVNTINNYNLNSLLSTSTDFYIISSLISLYSTLHNWINSSISMFSHPLLFASYVEKSDVTSRLKTLWIKFHKIDIFKFIKIIIKALSLHSIGYPISLSDIHKVSQYIINNSCYTDPNYINEFHAFRIILNKSTELFTKHFVARPVKNLSLNKKRNYRSHSILLDFYIKSHISMYELEEVSPSILALFSKGPKIPRIYTVKSRLYCRILTYLSHQFKRSTALKGDDINQILDTSKSILDKSVYYILSSDNTQNHVLKLLESCLDLFSNLCIYLVLNQLLTHDSFNNPNWHNTGDFCNIEERMGSVTFTTLCDITYKIFILVEQFDFRHCYDRFIVCIQKLAALVALLIHYELFNILYIKHHNIFFPLDFEKSYMIISLLSLLIFSLLIKSNVQIDNLINIIGVLLVVDHVYRDLLEDAFEFKYNSDRSEYLSFDWGFYNLSPNLFKYHISQRLIHLPSYIITACTSLFNTPLISAYSNELKLMGEGPYLPYKFEHIEQNKEVELDNWISVSFFQTYAINIYIGIPAPFDKAREKLRRIDKNINIPYFKLDITSCVISVYIHRYLNGMDMGDADALASCDYVASHDISSIENHDIIVSLCDSIDSFLKFLDLETIMMYKSLRMPYFNLLLGTKLDDFIYPFENLLFNTNVNNVDSMIELSDKALKALPNSQDLIYARLLLRVKRYVISLVDKPVDESELSDLVKCLEHEISKYSGKNPIRDIKELADEDEMYISDDVRAHRLEKYYLSYLTIVVSNPKLTVYFDSAFICTLNLLNSLSNNKQASKKIPSTDNSNFFTSILNSIGRIQWDFVKVGECYDMVTLISTIFICAKFLSILYHRISLGAILNTAFSLYIKALNLCCYYILGDKAPVLKDKNMAEYFSDVLKILEGKTTEEYSYIEYCVYKCIAFAFKYPSVAFADLDSLFEHIITNNANYPNISNALSIASILHKYASVTNFSIDVQKLTQSLCQTYTLYVSFDIFGYGLIKNIPNKNYAEISQAIESIHALVLLIDVHIRKAVTTQEIELSKEMDEFSKKITEYIEGISEDKPANSSMNGGKGRWIVIGIEEVESLNNINIIFEGILTIFNKISKKQQEYKAENNALTEVCDKIAQSLEALIAKCPEALSLPLTYKHFLTKDDCKNLLDKMKNDVKDNSIFSRYTKSTASIDVKLLKGIKTLIGIQSRFDFISKSEPYKRINNIFIKGCQKILYCQPLTDTVETSENSEFAEIDIREDLKIYANDKWTLNHQINSFRHATSAFTSAMIAPTASTNTTNI